MRATYQPSNPSYSSKCYAQACGVGNAKISDSVMDYGWKVDGKLEMILFEGDQLSKAYRDDNIKHDALEDTPESGIYFLQQK